MCVCVSLHIMAQNDAKLKKIKIKLNLAKILFGIEAAIFQKRRVKMFLFILFSCFTKTGIMLTSIAYLF